MDVGKESIMQSPFEWRVFRHRTRRLRREAFAPFLGQGLGRFG
jgi:hypothetical protein